MFPILIIAATKSPLKSAALLLYCCTSASCDPPLKSSWSEWNSPRRATRFWK
uniref:Uncharacterized protein n=1 Tax=Arundo donax TaxID=35708 RepID=A0A0A8YRY8_ARUDO